MMFWFIFSQSYEDTWRMEAAMEIVQVHAFPRNNVLHEANNVICLSIQFILY